MVEITATGGCRYVKVSLTRNGQNNVCPVRTYTIKLLSSTMDELASAKISHNQHTFNELPLNTLFYVTVLSSNAIVALSNSATTFVRTMDLKGSYVRMHKYSYAHIYIYYIYTHIYVHIYVVLYVLVLICTV